MLAQEAVTLAPTSAQIFAQLPAKWRDALNPNGSQLVTSVNGVSTTVVEVWWSKAVAGKRGKEKEPEINYPQLQIGAVMGVLNFPADSPEDFREDSRDQKLAPGFYTLRYAQPERSKDDDLGPFRDFAQVTQIKNDADPERNPGNTPLRTNHKAASLDAFIRLAPPNPAYDESPSLINDDGGQSVLQTKINVVGTGKDAVSIPIAIVLITPKKESGGS